jgi:phosphoribosylpyrophosphate synthetase
VSVRAFATHPLFAPGAEALVGHLDELVVTDTVSIESEPKDVLVLSVADVLAATIDSVFADRSVSAVFAGLNELF